jgi:hypothetical protein
MSPNPSWGLHGDVGVSQLLLHREKGIERTPQRETAAFIDLVWGSYRTDVSVWFETQFNRQNRRRAPQSLEDAVKLWNGGSARFFGVAPRKRPENVRDACVDLHDILWIDFDVGRPVSAREARAMLDPAIAKLGIPPSAIVYSGRAGVHVYWKLADRISIDRVEALNRALAIQLGGDLACWNRSRLLRIPETVNEKVGGRGVQLLHLDPEPLETAAFDVLGDVPPIGCRREEQGLRRVPGQTGEPEWLRESRNYDHWGERQDLKLGDAITGVMWGFTRFPPRRPWSGHGYRSRSEMEMAITYRLASKGWSDLQIKELADLGFPHHIEWQEQHPKDPDRYIDYTLASARERLFSKRRLVTSPHGGRPRTAYPKKRPPRFREYETAYELVRGQTRAELAAEIAEQSDRSRATGTAKSQSSRSSS